MAVLPPFVGGKRAELTSMPKIHWIDPGIRNHLVHDFRPLGERADAGAALESWVFSELWKIQPEGTSLHFWRSASGAEVDFVLARGETVVAVEVKAAHLGRPSVPRPLRSFLEAYRPAGAFLVNSGLTHRQTVDRTPVEWLAPQRLTERVLEIFA